MRKREREKNTCTHARAQKRQGKNAEGMPARPKKTRSKAWKKRLTSSYNHLNAMLNRSSHCQVDILNISWDHYRNAAV